MNKLKSNTILDADSYKFSHPSLYPHRMLASHSYIEARRKGEIVVPFGLQMWILSHLLNPIRTADVDEAEAFCKAHGEPFNRSDWDYIVSKHNGFLPIRIHAIPEGTPTPSLKPLITIESTDFRLPWLPSFVETSIQRGVWYPTTIASNDRKNYLLLKEYYDKFSDNPSMIPFALHDFGGRGVTSEESAQIGGAAHLVYFQGSDTISGVRAANHYYDCAMSAFSVPATEHSIQCAYGPFNQIDYLKTVLDTYAKPNAIVSIVLDGYDVYRESNLLCTRFKDQIIASGAKIVFRPDSGDALEVIPRILDMQAEAFGYTLNSKGKKVINHVGIIQGDGIDTTALAKLLEKITSHGYAPECCIAGSGGGLLQKVNRDTYSFAQKCSAIMLPPNNWKDGVVGEWVDVFKDPITDQGKRSKSGIQTTPDMVKVYEDGRLLVRYTLEEIRERAKA